MSSASPSGDEAPTAEYPSPRCNSAGNTAMKNLVLVGIVLVVFLVVSTQWPPSADVVEAAQKCGFSSDEIETGRTFAMQRRWIFWGRTLTQFGLILVLVFHPIGERLISKTSVLVQGHWFTHLVLLGGIYFFLSAALALPFRLASYFLNRHWEMTTQSFGGWLSDYATSLFVSGLLDLVVVAGFYGIVRSFPKTWWMVAGATSIVFGFVVAFIVPKFVDPLFNSFTPLSQTKWKNLEPRIRTLGQPIGIAPSDIFVSDASKQTKAANAYYTGFGASQRVVLFDNLLETHTPDEVETVVAHEMGHWHNSDILVGILVGGIAATAGLYLLFRYLTALTESGEIRSVGDVASLFRVILLAQVAFALTLPIQNWISRRMESNADQVSLDLSKKPHPFIGAEIQLAKQNKSDVIPSRWNVLLFATHPTVVQRIQMAEQWEKDRSAKK